MAGYLGSKPVLLSTTAATVGGDATIGGDLTVDTNTLFVDSTNNRIGIGTSSPAQKVHVVDGSYTGLRLETGDALGASYIDFGDNSDADVGGIAYWHTDNSMRFIANASERMRIDASGNVGIGVSSVSGVKMDVLATVSDNLVARFENNHATGSYGISVKAGDDSGNYAADFANKSGTSLMRIRGDGNVGIGTSSPFYALQVNRTPPVSGYDGISLEDSGNVIGLFKTGSSYTFGSVGSGQAWIYSNTSDLNITSDGSGIIKFQGENAAERMRIDSSGNVGIGTSSPSARLENSLSSNNTTKTTSTNNNTRAGFLCSAKTPAGVEVQTWIRSEGDAEAGVIFTQSNHKLGFSTNNAAPQMILNTSGDLLVGATSGPSTTGFGVLNYSGGNYIRIAHTTSAGSNDGYVQFYYNGNTIGQITQNGTSAVSYNTSSDYRLKEDVQPMVGASDRVLALNPVNFAWKADGTRVDGFLAHEAQAVVPEAVTGEKDAVDDDGNPKYQGIDQSKLVPLLTAALQEALNEITDLKARVAALEAV